MPKISSSLVRSFLRPHPIHVSRTNPGRRVVSCLVLSVCPRHNSKSPHSDIILSCGLSRARQPQPSYNRSRSLRSTACQLKALSFLSIIKIPYHAHQTTCLKIQKVAFPSFAENPILKEEWFRYHPFQPSMLLRVKAGRLRADARTFLDLQPIRICSPDGSLTCFRGVVIGCRRRRLKGGGCFMTRL
jgi:hypothetical protein